MTRTKIIAADGTEFESIPARTALRRKVIRRTISTAVLLITALFLSAAVIGLQKAAVEAPKANDTASYNDGWNSALADLEWIYRNGGKDQIMNCLEASHTSDELGACLGKDNMTPAAATVKATWLPIARAACAKAPRGAMQDCLALYMRGAWFDARTYTPAGPALVKECISQYRGAELADCFTQEIG